MTCTAPRDRGRSALLVRLLGPEAPRPGAATLHLCAEAVGPRWSGTHLPYERRGAMPAILRCIPSGGGRLHETGVADCFTGGAVAYSTQGRLQGLLLSRTAAMLRGAITPTRRPVCRDWWNNRMSAKFCSKSQGPARRRSLGVSNFSPRPGSVLSEWLPWPWRGGRAGSAGGIVMERRGRSVSGGPRLK